MKRTLIGASALALSAVLVACGTEVLVNPTEEATAEPNETLPSPPVAVPDGPVAGEAILATNSLGLDLLLSQERDENVIVSPASLTIALALLAEGATGEAAAELNGLLGLSGTERTEAYSALNAALNAYRDGEFSMEEIPENPLLRVANNVVVNDGFPVKDAFTDSLTGNFDATVDVTDLGSPAAKELLDAWVKEHTEGLIEKSSIEPDASLQLVLQNALLFAARWESLFIPGFTVQEDFTRADGSAVTADLMTAEIEVLYGEADGYTAIRLPYTSDFGAFFVLPPEGETATAEGINAAIAAATNTVRAEVQIPSFDLNAQTDVMDFLAANGVSAIFTDGGSFGEISDVPLVVGAIAQQARLIVNESGTVGAALTEIAMATSMPPPATHEFRADRPFVMVVRHDATGVDLFTAHIADPTA